MRAPLRLVLPIASALLALILVLAIVLGHSSGRSPSGSGETGTTQSNRGFDGAVLPAGVRAPDFTLTDQRGERTSLSSYRGAVVVLVFLSSSCRACVLVAQQVRGALDELAPAASARQSGPAPGVQAIFVSADPARDNPTRISRFLSETSLSGRVEYLTSTDIARLRAAWHSYDVPTTRSGRTAAYPASTVLLIDRHGEERVEFGLEQLTPESLAHDIRMLQH